MPSSSLPENGTPPSPNGQGQLYEEARDVLGRGARSTSLREWLGLLWNGKWIILAACVLSMAAAGAYVYSIPDTYRTSTLLYLDRDKGQSLNLGRGNSRSSFFREDNTLENELFLLKNSNVIPRRVAERLQRLGRHPDTGAPLPILVTAQGDSLPTGSVARRVQGSVGAGPAGGEGVDALRIHVTSSSPDQGALLANLYAEEYIRRTKERSRQTIRASRQFLEKQADKLEKDVKQAEARIERYMQKSGAVSLDQESSRIVSRISDLESRRSELRIEIDMKTARLDTLRADLAKMEPKLAEQLSSSLNERLTRVQEEKAKLEAQIDRIEQRNPGVDGSGTRARELREMRKRVDVLTQKADSLAQVYVDQSLAAGMGGDGESGGVSAVVQKRRQAAQLRIEVSGLKAQLTNVKQELQEARARLQTVPEQSMQLAQLQRQRRSAEQIFGFVREKLQEIRLSEQSEVGFAEIVRPAPISRAPIGPALQPNLILALIFGAGLGAGIVVIWAKLDTHVYEPDDIKQKGYPMVGVVPSMDALIQEQFGGDSRLQIDDHNVGTELVLLTSPMSAPAEAYRRIRTNLQFARPDEALDVMAVTSADKGEGKTTTTANLALAMASAGQKTILIDADLRNPRLHRIFDHSRSPGLTQLLFDDGPRRGEAFSSDIDNLSLVPAGEEVPNPAELLGSQRMQTLIDELREHYDVVLFDTPPVLLFSDALALGSHCDGAMVVASAGKSDARAVDHAAEQVESVGSSFLGCILNRYDSSRSTLYGYGYNYGYAQSYERLSDYYYEQSGSADKSRLRTWWGS